MSLIKSKKFLVVGESTRRSLSPLIFNYWFSKHSIDCKYNYKEITKKKFRTEIKKILNEKEICGLNVTIPFKEKIIPYLDEIDKHSKEIGAVNCITKKNNKIYGSNTDWIGYSNTLKEKTKGQDGKKKEAIIIGYGGAAKAIIYALLKLEYKKIHVFNRTLEKLNKIERGNNKIEAHALLKINDYIKSSNLIINTTPVNILEGLNTPTTLPPNVIISDVVYEPLETKFLKYFNNPKHKTYGMSMLINQAIPCFEKWFGIVPTADKKLLEIIKNVIDT